MTPIRYLLGALAMMVWGWLTQQSASASRDQVDREHAQKVYDDLVTERNALVAAGREATKSLDQGLIALAGSLLALSITFVEKLAARPPRYVELLGAAWALLLLSLLATLLSFRWSRMAYDQEISNRIADYNEYLANPNAPPRDRSDKFTSRTGQANAAAIVAFFLGVGLLSLFTLINLPYRAPVTSTPGQASPGPCITLCATAQPSQP